MTNPQPESMIGRVARAMRGSAKSDEASILCEEFAGWGEDEDFILLARAAIEAMREPTDVMVAAAYRDHIPDGADAWQAMIDAAMGEG
tara:strand:- start:24691 stop:24954 length:264 start_codon:yes stop_codon:yes gene_type:complete